MQYKVSVVVPIYNGEKYIERCCENLINQSLKEIQIILVDDGSNDKTRDKIQFYQSRYENITMLYQENKGVSVARNFGIEQCKGEYIGFVDVDDVIELDMFELMYETACKYNLDVVCMDNIGKIGEVTIFESNEKAIVALLQEDINMSSCNKLFKKSLLHNPVFPEGKRIHEDLFAVYKVLSVAKYVGCININKYHYITHEGSSSRTFVFSEKYFDAIELAEIMYQDAKNKFPNLINEAEARKAKTFLRITKIYYLRKSPRKYKKQIEVLKRYLKSLSIKKIMRYYSRNDIIRYYLCLYFFPLFILLIKTIDRK